MDMLLGICFGDWMVYVPDDSGCGGGWDCVDGDWGDVVMAYKPEMQEKDIEGFGAEKQPLVRYEDELVKGSATPIKYADCASALTDWVLGMGDAKGAMDFIGNWVASGRSMIAFCKHYGLDYGVVGSWIRGDKDRDVVYQAALRDRGSYRREKLVDGFWQTAQMVPVDPVSHGDVHRAREALAKVEGMYKTDDNGGRFGGGGGMPEKITIVFVDSHEGRPSEKVING